MQVDYIIIGAGSAGCIIAEGLSRSGDHSVLLIEAGGKLHNPWINIPAGFGATYYNPKYNYMYQGQAEPSLNGRRMYVPRGKGLGGSGSINAMIYVRGSAQDFDDWAAAGNPNWSYQHVLPYFKSLETFHGSQLPGQANQQQAQTPPHYFDNRGSQGNIHVSSMADQAHDICFDYLQATQELGWPQNNGFNSANIEDKSIEGAAIYEANIYKGRRHSSYQGYLKPALQRSNLSLWTHAQVQQLIVKDKQVQGISVQYQGQVLHVYSQKETILCAGAVANPQLLQLSGIGNPALLAQHNIACQHSLPTVGENLQDHYCASFYFRSRKPTLNDDFGTLTGKLKAAWQYLSKCQGPLSLSVNQAGGFFYGAKSANENNLQPNIQLYFNPLSYEIPENPNARLQPLPYSGFLVAANPCRPISKGSIHIQSSNPKQMPAIQFNFLSTQEDQQQAIQAGNLIRQLMQAPALQKITEAEVKPANTVSNDTQMLTYFQKNGHSIYHLCGTCAMGSDVSQNVVDERLKVHGLEGLRIADASIFPNITAGNINAPTMMLALKAVDIILLGTSSLKPSHIKT